MNRATRLRFSLLAWVLLLKPSMAIEVPIATVADTINPGSADYILSTIAAAEKAKAPYLVIQLDTAGGLLNTTRQIVQGILNASVPVVVFVGPKGAHAGSAGALITFAADIAAMAPGTNIGAAHPVGVGGGDTGDNVMKDKVANDVAAFAESLAKSKGRNADWAIKAVRNSASLTNDDALKLGVIDLIAEDTQDLLKKLPGFTLRVAKGGATALPQESATPHIVPMTIKHRVVSFLADPNLAYLIMTLGGVCLWIELSHPGLIVPGVVGALCMIVSLVSFQTLPIDYGALALILLGMALLVAELYLPTFGLLGIGGLVAFVVGSLFLMDTSVPEFQISLKLILPTATTIAAFGVFLGFLIYRARNSRPRSGVEALIGEFAEVREKVSDHRGKVFVNGEIWNAVSHDGKTIGPGTIVRVCEFKNMCLVVEPGEVTNARV